MDKKSQIQEDFMKELGLENLPEDKQKELIVTMTEAVMKRIFAKTMEKLNEEDREKYAKMIDEKVSSEEIDKFLAEKIPDYEKMIQEVISIFKEELKKN